MFHSHIETVHVKNRRKRKANIPKSLIVYFMIQLLFGTDYGFIKLFKTKFQKATMISSIAMSVLMFIGLAGPILDRYIDIWCWIGLVEYITWLLATRTVKYKIYDFLLDMDEINEMTPPEKRTVRIISLDYVIFICCIKIIILTVQCLHLLQEYCITYKFPYYALYMVPTLGLEFFGSAHRVVIYYIYCSLRSIKESLKNTQISFNVEERRYLALANCYDEIKPVNDNITITLLIFSVPKFMATLWFVLYNIKINAKWTDYVLEFIFSTAFALQIFVPALITEMVRSQVDAIKLILRKELLTEKDTKRITEVTHFLQCLKVHRVDHLVLRFIPTDVRLLLSLFGLCTSYFIVILQFTHLYD